MQLTLRLKNDNYLDVLLDISKRELTFLSPIPNIELKELLQICDTFHYKINLPITGQTIKPDVEQLPTKEIEESYTLDTPTVLILLLTLSNLIISEG